jgi:hypothetical protein
MATGGVKIFYGVRCNTKKARLWKMLGMNLFINWNGGYKFMVGNNKYKVSDVYGIGRDLPLNYVTRILVDEAFINSLTRDKHIVIYGSSKQGKTSLRKHCLSEDDYIVIHCSNKWGIAELNSAILKKVGYEITQSTSKTTTGRNKIVAAIKASVFGIGTDLSGEKEKTLAETVNTKRLELDPDDVNDIIKALGDFKKYIVLEDFHYLSIETQKDFAVALKAYHEQSALCFIVVGVWLEEGRLTVYNGDLTGRILAINADKWTNDELQEVISKGEDMLRIKLDSTFKRVLLENCFDNVYIIQEACYQACVKQGVNFTQESLVLVGEDLDAKQVIQEVVNQQTGRYNSFINQFSAGFQETALQMYKWLLYPVLTSDIKSLEKGLSYRALRDVLREHHPEKRKLNLGNLTQALQATASLQVKKDASCAESELT